MERIKFQSLVKSYVGNIEEEISPLPLVKKERGVRRNKNA